MSRQIEGYEPMELHDEGPSDEEEEETSCTDATVIEDPQEELEGLRKKLELAKEVEKDKAEELGRVTEFWAARELALKTQLAQTDRSAEDLEFQIFELEHRIQHGLAPPPGPRWLRFVDGNTFSGVVAVVIIINMITMTMGIMHHKYRDRFMIIDRACVIFYVVEIALRAGYWQNKFLVGNCSVIVWHWIDTLIVLDGILYVTLPESPQTSWTGYVRAVRLVRYIRVVKLIHTVLHSNLSWTEGEKFQTAIMVVICANAIVMGAEVEYPGPPFEFIWLCLEHLFLLTFAFELAVRLKYQGGAFFTKPGDKYWNWLDFVIVVGGVIDQWLLPAITIINVVMLGNDDTKGQSTSMGDLLRIIRIARLLRILRLMRLIKNIPPLYTLIVGIVKAMQGMSWVMLLTITVLYISALIGVKLVGPRGLLFPTAITVADEGPISAPARLLHGHGGGGGAGGGGSEELAGCFPNMFDAIFNMFKVMQMDLEPMEPLFVWSPMSKYIIMFYVVVTNWAIFSILTAVVSDEMAKVTEKLEEEVSDQEKKKKNNKLVEKIFDRIDRDKSGTITKADFMTLLENEHETSELCAAADLEPDDLQEFVEILSHEQEEGEGATVVMTRQEFLDGLEKERNTVNTRAMMKLEKRLDEIDDRIYSGISSLEALVKKSVGITPRTPALSMASPPAFGSPVQGFGAASPAAQRAAGSSSLRPPGSLARLLPQPR